MGKRSREKRERFASKNLGENWKERQLRPKTHVEELCLFIITAITYLTLFTPLIMNGNFFFPFVSPKSLYFMGLVQIMFFIWLFLIFYFPQYRPQKNPLLVALILFLVVLTLSSAFGENPSYSFWSKPERMTGLLMWFHLFAFFLVVSSVFRKKEDWFKIFAVAVSVGVILGFIALSSTNPAMRGGATVGNTSFLGTCFVFVIFFALYLIFGPGKEIKLQNIYRWWGVICFLIIVLTFMLVNGARAAKLSFLFSLVILFFLWLIFYKKGVLKLVGAFLLVVFLISTLYFVFLAFQPDSFVRKEIAERFVGQAYMETIGGRLPVWQESWKGFLEKPLLGWGLENFELSFMKNYNPCMGTPKCGVDIWYDRAHNIIFDTLVTTGILGMVSYLGIFLAIFYLLWKRYLIFYAPPVSDDSEKYRENTFGDNNQKIKSPGGGVEFWTAGIFSVVLIGYSIQNLTVFDMISSYLMFFLVLGFVASVAVPREELIPQKNISVKPWFSLIFLILFAFSFFYFVIQPLKTSYYTVASLGVPAASSAGRLDLYKKALASSPLGKYQIREFFGQTTLELAQSEQVAEQVPVENFKEELDFVIEELEKSITESPLDFRAYLKLGQLYNAYLRLGQLYNAYAVLLDPTKMSGAERVLGRAIEVSPTNQQGYWSLAQTRIYQGRPDEALSLAEKAVALEPNLFQSHLIVVRIAQIMGDNELTQRKIKEAIEINPAWATSLVPTPN